MLVLREDDRVGERAEPDAAVAEDRAGDPGRADPEVHRDDADAAIDHGRGQAERLVELERPRLHRERARRGAGLRRLVDDANADAQPREPEGEDEPRRPRSDDEDRALAR